MATQRRGIGVAIGLNAVDPAHYAGWTGELHGCEADAEAIAQLASARDFQMVTLLTQAATRAAARSAIERAARELADGDTFLLSYAGHGGQVPDVDGDEDDYRDETWALHDGLVIDDELHVWLSSFATGVRVLVLSDSCHSGTVTRAYEAELAAAVTAMPGAIVRRMPDDVALRTYARNREDYIQIQRTIPVAVRSTVRATVRLLAACQDDQLALDAPDHGLFTSTLLKVWNHGSFTGSYDELHRTIVSRMPDYQTPNHFVIGPANPAFDAGPPFTL
jgi:hypothetical protein